MKFNKPNRKIYGDRLKKAFPENLEKEVENVINILPLENHQAKLANGESYEMENLIHSSEYEVLLNSEKLIIPYRLYFDEPEEDKEKGLSKIETEILHCIYLRHHNGYLREARLKKLMNSKNDFVIPFTIQLLGEYVFEIIKTLDRHLNEANLRLYQKLMEENPRYWLKTESRMISYWDAYYRKKSPKLEEYLGYELVQRIKGKQIKGRKY